MTDSSDRPEPPARRASYRMAILAGPGEAGRLGPPRSLEVLADPALLDPAVEDGGPPLVLSEAGATDSEAALKAALERSTRELENIAYVASHDLRAPLRAFLTLPDWIREDMDEAGIDIGPIAEHLEMMEIQARRMNALLTDLLDYSRIGRLNQAPEPVDIGEMLHGLATHLDPGHRARVRMPVQLPVLLAPKADLLLLLRQLLSNCLKHSDQPHPDIRIAAQLRGDRLDLTVSDDGPGIPAEFHERVFGMFTTLRSRDEVEGSGMGLAMVKKIAELWGGEVAILPVPEGGRGTTLRISLPSEMVLPGARARAS